MKRREIRSHQSRCVRRSPDCSSILVRGVSLGGNQYEIEIRGTAAVGWYAALTANRYTKYHQSARYK